MLLLLLLYCATAHGAVNLWITPKEMYRTLEVNSSMDYVENGIVNNHAVKFAYRVSEHISELRYTWSTVGNTKVHYKMHLDAGHQVVAKLLHIPPEGFIPKDISDFSIEYRCAGSHSGQFEVSLHIEFAWPDRNTTRVRLRQEKVCALRDGRRRVGTEDERSGHASSGDDGIDGGEKIFYIIIGVAAAFLGLILILLVMYFRGSKKDEQDSIMRRSGRFASSMRSSFHSRQPFLTSTPKSANSSANPLRPSASPILDRTATTDVRQVLCDLYADRNLFQVMQFVELEGSYSEMRWAIWRQNASGESGDIDDDEDAVVGDEAVIVKTLKSTATRAQFERFLTDSFVFHAVPAHPNLAQVAAAASFGRFENPESVTDFPLICYRHRGFGNLKKFLLSCREERERKREHGKSSASTSSAGSGPGQTLRTHELVSIGVQVARAVAHLHKYGLLHRELATRNCLVAEVPGAKTASERLLVQVTDPAISRDIWPDDYTCVGDTEPRPIKWTALEVLRGETYTSAADIWSLGVLLWELISGGAQPWEDVPADDVQARLEMGERLGQPAGCPDDLYAIMLSCWSRYPRERPNAVQLLTRLVEFNIQLKRYI